MFDGFEIHKVVGLVNGEPVRWEDGRDVEVVEDGHDTTVPGAFFRWSLYGHLPNGGVESIADFFTEADALAAKAALDRRDRS